MLRVLAVDPGERVGWATGVIKREPVAEAVNQGISSHDLGGTLPPAGSRRYWDHSLTVTAHGIAFLKDAALQIHKAVVTEDRIDVLIYETFILTARGAKVMVGSDLQTAQFVGMCRLAAWLNPRVELCPQGPGAMSSANKSMNSHPSGGELQERLAKLPRSHDESHDGSALRHMWSFFFNRFV